MNSPDKPLEGMTKVEQDAVFYNLYKSVLSILRKREGKNNQKADIELDKRIRAIETNDKIVTTDMQAYKGNTDKRMRAEETDDGITVPKIKLRSQPIENLTEDAVEIMVKDKRFFDSSLNKLGTGFPHQYEVQKEGKVVYDHASDLMWQQSGSTKEMPYEKAKAYVEALNSQNFAGYRDWRLPTLEEAMSLMESTKMNGDLYVDPKFDKQQRGFWTSDTYSASGAWVVDFYYGYCSSSDIGNSNCYVRAVR